MSSKVSALLTLLDTNVASLVGLSVPPLPIDAAFPYAIVRETVSKESETLDDTQGLSRAIMQVEVWSPVYESADAAREACKVFLLVFKGSASGWTIKAVNHWGDTEFYDGNRELHQCISRYAIWWSK